MATISYVEIEYNGRKGKHFQWTLGDDDVGQPVTLVSDGSNRTIILDRYKFTSQIAKRDVAEWMIDAIERPEPFTNHSEMIGWA